MARGGFKAFMVDVHGVSGGGNTTHVERVITEIANGIIDTNQGWSYSSSSPTNILSAGTNGRFTILEHTNGTKLCVAMQITNGSSTEFDTSDFLHISDSTDTGLYYTFFGGLMMSMIPPGMGDYDISNPTSSSFMPTTALRFSCFGFSSYTTYNKCFVERSDMDGIIFRYMCIVKNDCIMVAGRRLDVSSSCFFYTLGNMAECIQTGDTNSYISFNPICSTNDTYEGTSSQQQLNNNTVSSNDSLGSTSYANAQIYAEDDGLLAGSVRKYSGSTTAGGKARVSRYTDVAISFGSNSRRFVPFLLSMKNDYSYPDYGVTRGDNFKGTINPEILCQVYHTGSTSGSDLSLSAILDNGNYMHLCNGIIVGWDASNTFDFWDSTPASTVLDWSTTPDPAPTTKTLFYEYTNSSVIPTTRNAFENNTFQSALRNALQHSEFKRSFETTFSQPVGSVSVDSYNVKFGNFNFDTITLEYEEFDYVEMPSHDYTTENCYSYKIYDTNVVLTIGIPHSADRIMIIKVEYTP